MLDPKLIRKEPDRVKRGLKAKGMDPGLLDSWLELDLSRRTALMEVESKKAERNQKSQEVGRLRKAGEDASALEGQVRKQGDAIKALDQTIRDTEAKLNSLAEAFPNMPHATTPVGGESENQILRTVGDPVKHAFAPQQHDELGLELGLLDFEGGSRISGSGFPVLRGQGARLNRALISYMLDLHVQEHGYTELAFPYLVKREAVFGTGQLPKLEEDMYRTDRDDMFLIPTGEVSITNLHRGEILAETDLPLTYVGCSPCFRRESGSYGQDTRGMTRVHQFDKVEMVKFVHPDASYEEHEILLANAETVLQRLGLTYRVLLLASGDLSFAAAKCYDLEVWAPGAERWLEVSSCSNFEDFQGRRADIRFKPAGGGRPVFVHTINGSGLALPRTLIALLETYQTESGAVGVPEVLQPYLGGMTELS